MAKTYVVATSDTLGKIGQVHASHGKLVYVSGLQASA